MEITAVTLPQTAITYLRVSGAGQCVDGKDGFPRQQEAVTKYAEANGIQILAEYRDEGLTGKLELENRPGLAACLERIENNGVKLVIVESADRLARDSMVSELIIRQFQKAGGRVVSASGGVDLTAGDDANPTAKLVRQVLAAVAEFDRCVTVLKLRAARQRAKVRDGKCEGVKPFGTFTTEVPILSQILEMKCGGMNSEKIAAKLNELGVKSRSGAVWRGSVIRKILKRSTLHKKAA